MSSLASPLSAAFLIVFASAAASPADQGAEGRQGDAGVVAEPAQAEAAVLRSTQLSKDSAEALGLRDYPSAYRLADEAVALNPMNAQALNFRAMSLSQMRRYADAVRDASAALGLAPGNAAALHTRSWAFAKQGRYREALEDARSALAREPSNAFLYQDQALALAGLGDRPGALDALRRSAALDSRFAERLARAAQSPTDADMTLLFEEGVSSPSRSIPLSRRFLRLSILALSGGLLVALGILHVFSPEWKERAATTMRRALGSPRPPAQSGFWTQYELIREIGTGGMGVVYEARDRALDRRVAIKKMRDEIRLDAGERRRFVAEARSVARLHHPNIADIYAIAEEGADLYLVFEFVGRNTLRDALRSDGAMPWARARETIRQIAAAVSHAHERGIIHRDLKPSNVMLTAEGQAKVMDFGIARRVKDAVTARSTVTVTGTPAYMAPEQEQGSVRAESDVYALGVCLYETATGRLPFSGSGAAMLLHKLGGKPIPVDSALRLPAGLDAVFARVLAPDPDKRFRTPGEFVAALDALNAASSA